MFSTYDCAVKGFRKKEDPYVKTENLLKISYDLRACILTKFNRYNAIIAGFFTGGSLAVRGGFKAARNSAIGCAVLLAVIEGVGIGIQRMMADNTRLDAPPPPPQQGQLPTSAGAIA